METMQIFENGTFGKLNCYEKDGVAYLELETVARGLGFTDIHNGTNYIRWARVDKYLEELGFATSGERAEYIPENIFYRLAMKAKNETAEKFQAWIADDVIPTMRKTGGYVNDDELFINTYFVDMDDDSKMIFRTTLARLRKAHEKIRIDKPKVDFAERVIADDESLIDMNTFAKMVEEKKILPDGKMKRLGRNGLFSLLRGMNILQKTNKNVPYQIHINNGYFVVKYPKGYEGKSCPKTLITGKGQVWLTKKLKEYFQFS